MKYHPNSRTEPRVAARRLTHLIRGAAAAFTLVQALVASSAADLIINEFTGAGQSVLADEDGGYHDWIELHNPGPAAVNVAGWHLTDEPDQPNKWTFPPRNVAGGGYLVVFASAKNRTPTDGPLHTNFRLSAAGETLLLTRPDGSIAREIAYPVQIPDISFDGTSFLREPTPGFANSEPLAIAMPPVFSQSHGFFDAPFSLTLASTTPGASVRYTVDGTEPSSNNGTTYSAPIQIARTTVFRAVALAEGLQPSPVVTQTYLFLKDVVKQSPDGKVPSGWPKKWGRNVVDYGMDPRITQRAPYKRTLQEDLRAVPTLSIAMELPALFDSVDGIYANPSEKGDEWERPMSIELIQPDGSPGFQINGGLRIRGGASRDTGNPKHSFRVLFRKGYGAPELKYPLFGPDGAETTSRFDLRWDHLVSWHYASDPQATQLPDIFGRDSQLATGSPAKRGNFFHLYINGQYWGVYQTDERVTADWAAAYFGGGDDDYDVVKFDPEANYGTGYADGTPAAWRRLIEAGVRSFRSNEEYYRVQGLNPDGTRNSTYERLLDVDNLIDYMLVGVYCAATDNPPSGGIQNNWYGFRSRKNDFGFRFFVHDFELSMASKEDDVVNREPSEDPFEFVDVQSANPWHFWEAARQNPEFRLRVADHIQRHFFDGGILTPEAAAARWQSRMDELDRAIVAESARWGQPVGNQGGGPIFAARAANDWRTWFSGLAPQANRRVIVPGGPGGGGGQKKQYTREDWLAASTAKLTDYFPERTGIVLQQLKEAGLFPAVAAPEVVPPAPPSDGLTLLNPNAAGTIYYTLDESDPRRIGGSIAAGAAIYGEPILVSHPTPVHARVLIGNEWSALLKATAQPAEDFSGLRITEIHYNPPAVITSDDAEFLELKNVGEATINLGGGSFTAGITYLFPPGTTLAPGAHYVIARDAAVFAQLHPGVTLNGVYTGRLANEGEPLTIQSAAGLVILSMRYDNTAPWPSAANGAGFSLVPRKPGGDASEPENWRASTALSGSPGADDPVAPEFPRVVINEVLANEDPAIPALDQDAIELKNPGAVPADISGWYLTNSLSAATKFRIPNGTILPPGGLVAFRASNFAANGVVLPSQGGEVWLLSGAANVLTGYAHGFEYGAQDDGVTFGLVTATDGREYFPALSAPSLGLPNHPPANSRVRISEIQYAPAPGGDEFVELENTLDATVPLEGGILNGLGYTFPPAASLPPLGKILVVTTDPAAFRTKYSVDPKVPIYGPAPSPLQDNGEFVSLQVPALADGAPGLLTIDAVRYNDRRPWPSLAAGFGVSLQRAAGPNFAGEPGNWLASAPTPGGTNSGNFPPEIELTSPLNLTDVIAPARVHFAATSTDRDGTIQRVEFRVDSEVVGEDTEAPYTFDWTPTPGLHDLTARATDNAGAVTESDFVTINVDAPESGIGRGLHGEYFANTEFAGTPVERDDPAIDFDWVEIPPIEGVPRKRFSVRWTGSVVPRRSGGHTFSVAVTGATRLYINDELVIEGGDESIQTGETQYLEGFSDLTAGQLASVRLEYVDTDGYAHIELRWVEPGEFDSPLVPQTQLYLPGQAPTDLGIATSSPLPPRRIARDFRIQLQAANGRRPYIWSISGGALPPGVNLSSTGLLEGPATTAGIHEFVVTVTDADGVIADKPFQLQVLDTSQPELKPVVQIVEPLEDTSFRGDPSVRVRGTARSSRPLARVEYMVNFGPWHTLRDTTAWSFVLTSSKGLAAGDNTVRVRAFDIDGRESRNVQRHFRRNVRAPLTVAVEGSGTVTPGFLGVSTRTVGEEYTIVATPAPGWVFREWSGLFVPQRRLLFRMEEGLQLTAVFEPNPYPALAGRYSGLLNPLPGFPDPVDRIVVGPDPDPEPEEIPVSHANRGALDLQLTANGTFTVTLRFAGRTHRTRGRFDSFGNFFADFSGSKGAESLTMSLLLLRDTGQIDARVSYFRGDFFGESGGLLEVSNFSATNPCPLAGRFTVRLASEDVSHPSGSGFAALQVKANGNGRFIGELPDGSPWSATARLRNDFGAVLYSPLYGGEGSISGLLPFSGTLGERSTGSLFWPRPASSEAPQFAVGFSGLIAATASPYLPPSPGAPAISLEEGHLILEGGDLPAAIEKVVSLDSSHEFVISPELSDAIHLTIDPATGLLSGNFAHPQSGLVPIRGTVDQFDNTAAGYFLGPQSGGSLRISPLIILQRKATPPQ